MTNADERRPLPEDALYDDTHAPEDGVAERFVEAMSSLAAAVSVIAVTSPRSGRAGLTATAVTSLSAEPPMLVACLNRSSSLAKALPTTGWFSVNVLAADQQDVAEVFAGRTGLSGEDRFSAGTWRVHPHGVPVLEGAAATFVCHVGNSMHQSTHTVVIGSVHDVVLPAGDAPTPLMYHRRRFVTLGATPPAAPR
ncbi:flavin reductase family protein [Kineosporia sp. R_H_3]|uniref:flavin reductase family protein n=1 Tax=Kineosporia sp. R_H_3 TaxID=1961848 RepID=UPI000B4A8790|nr:flavin reductase family protein [Kineosporia sp. R_H_3]